jgi:hypothetical protein
LKFFPPNLFLVFWKRKIFLNKKNFGGKKINLAKKFFHLAKTILPKFKPFCKIIKKKLILIFYIFFIFHILIVLQKQKKTLNSQSENSIFPSSF